MSATVTDRFRVNRAREFLAEIGSASFYLTIGKPTPWPVDATPPAPSDATEDRDYIYWADMLGAKKIVTSNCSLVVPRYNWTSGVIYDQYLSDDPLMLRKRFYAMTTVGDGTYRVYKVIDNYGGAPSTVEPTTESTTGVQITSDKYIWKFMYKISAVDAAAWLTSQHMPVKDLDSNDGSLQWQVHAAAVSGAILGCHVVLPGTGYGTSSSIPITIAGDGSGATAHGVSVAGFLRQIIIDTAGSSYTFATVTVGGAGTGATGKAALAPYSGGHGSDPVMELGAYNFQSLVALQYDESETLTTDNEFREIGILKNPKNFGTNTTSTALNMRQTYKIGLNTVTGNFTADERVTQSVSNASATVVYHDVTNQILYVNDVVGTLVYGDTKTVTGGTSGTTARFSAALGDTNPGFKQRSGDFFYMENRQPIPRAIDEVENIKIVLEF